MAAYIFDFDGTIADTFDYVLDFLATAIHGPAYDASLHHTEYRGYSMYAMARRLGAKHWRLPLLFFNGRKMMAPAMARIQLFDGMAEVIKSLHDSGNQLFIVSVNRAENVNAFLARYNLLDYFIEVNGGAILGKAPVIKRIIRKFHLLDSDCWYVGDEANDILAARKAGIKALAVTWGYNNLELLQSQQPDALVFTPDELLRVGSLAKNQV